jgi:hypothetical protein
MEPVTDSAPVDAVPVDAPAPADTPPEAAPVAVEAVEATPVAVEATQPATPGTTGGFVSLYDSAGTALIAIVLGLLIVGGIQFTVARIFANAKDEHRALTQFVVSMVAIMVGVYVSDMLIAGPTAELLAEGERSAILSFVKDTALMIFAYYFGTKAVSVKDTE